MIFYFNKKPLVYSPSNELHIQIKEYEDIINTPLSIFGDEDEHNFINKLNKLTTEERRLFIIYSIYDCSVNKVAQLFNVDRKTIYNRINEIKEKLC